MNITRLAIANPVAVVAAVLLVLLLGAVGLSKLPVQMIPDAERPFIQISTGWRAAALGRLLRSLGLPRHLGR